MTSKNTLLLVRVSLSDTGDISVEQQHTKAIY